MPDDSDKKAERFAEELLKRIQSKEPRQKRNIFDYEIKKPHTLRKSMVTRAKQPLEKSIVCSTPARTSKKFPKIFCQVSPIRSQKSNEQFSNDIVTISSSNDTTKENGIKQKNQDKILSINKSPFINQHKKILQPSTSENNTDKGINQQLQDEIISRSESPFIYQHKKIVQTSSFENNTDNGTNQQLQNEVISRTKSPFIDQHEKIIQTSLFENNIDKGINQFLQDKVLPRTKSPFIVKRKEETKIPVFKKSKLPDKHKKLHKKISKSCSEQDYLNNSLKKLNSSSSKIKGRGRRGKERDQIHLPSSEQSDKTEKNYPNIAQVNMLNQPINDSCFNKYPSDFMFVNCNTPQEPDSNSPQLNVNEDNINYMLDKHHSIPHTKTSVDSDESDERMIDLAHLALQTNDSYSHNSSDFDLLKKITNLPSKVGTSSIPENNTNGVKNWSCRLFRSLSEGDIMETFSNDNIIDFTQRPWRISGLSMDNTRNRFSIKRCIANSFKNIDDDTVTDNESVLDEQSAQFNKNSVKFYKRKDLICDKNKGKVNTLFDSSSDEDTYGKNNTEKISRKCNKRNRIQPERRQHSLRDSLTEDADTLLDKSSSIPNAIKSPTTDKVTRKNNRRHEKQVDSNKKSSNKKPINQVNSNKNEEHNLQINNQNTGGKKMTEEISRKCDKTKRTQPTSELHSSHDSLIEETNKIFDKSSTIRNTIESNRKSSRTEEIRRKHNGRLEKHASSDKESSKKNPIGQVNSDKNEENNLLVTNNTSTVGSWLQVINHSFYEQNSMHDNNNCLDIDIYSNETQNTEDINLRRRRSLRILIDRLIDRRHEKQVDSNKKSSKKKRINKFNSDKNEEHNLLETNNKNTDEKMTEEISSKCDERKITQATRELSSSHVSLTEDSNKQLDNYSTTRNTIKLPTTDELKKKNSRRHEKQVDSNKKTSKKNRINQVNSDENEEQNLLEAVGSLLEAINVSLNEQNSILEEIDNYSNEAQDINLHGRPSLRILIDRATYNSTTNLEEKKNHQKKINTPLVNVENHNSDKSINTVLNNSPQMKTRNKTKNMKINNLNTQNRVNNSVLDEDNEKIDRKQIIASIIPNRLFNNSGSTENLIPFDDEEINNRNIVINSSGQNKNDSNNTNVGADQFKEPPKKRGRGRKKGYNVECAVEGEKASQGNCSTRTDAHQFKEPPRKRALRKKQSNNAECSVDPEKSSQQDRNSSTRTGLQRSCRNRSCRKIDLVYITERSGFKNVRTDFEPSSSDVLSICSEPNVTNKKTRNTGKKRSAQNSELPTIPESKTLRKETDSEHSDDNIAGSSNNNRDNDNFTLSTDEGILKDIDYDISRSKRRKRIVASTPASTVSHPIKQLATRNFTIDTINNTNTDEENQKKSPGIYKELKYVCGSLDEGVLFTNTRDDKDISVRFIKILPGKKKENHINNKFKLYFTHVQGIGKIIVNNQKYSVVPSSVVLVHEGATYSIRNSSDTCELILASTIINERKN